MGIYLLTHEQRKEQTSRQLYLFANIATQRQSGNGTNRGD
jgi:hypothetical protein